MAEFTMPSLGADMDEGTLLEWLVAPGDAVHKGDVVAVVDTAKAAVEVETFADGVVEALLVQPGTTVPVGTPLASIGVGPVAPAAAAKPAKPAKPAKSARPARPANPRRAAEPVKPAARGAKARPPVHPPAPVVRRVARDLGVDLATLTGSGPGGEITRDDVVHAADQHPAPAARTTPAPPAPAPREGTRVSPYARRLATELGVDLAAVPLPADGVVRAADVRAAASGPAPTAAPPVAASAAPDAEDRRQRMRSAIATVMSHSKREIPHYYLTSTVNLGAALDWMHERNRDLPVTARLVPAALMLKATALAATEVPEVNGFWVDDRFQPATDVHVGMAISLRGGGLLAPAVHDTARLSLDAVMAAMRDLVVRARSGRLRDTELREPTLTVTNLGEQGVESVLGVIYPPQVALVGFGTVVERPWAIGGLLGVRPVTTLTLSADHRATDGFTGSRFLAAIDRHLQHPEAL